MYEVQIFYVANGGEHRFTSDDLTVAYQYLLAHKDDEGVDEVYFNDLVNMVELQQVNR